MPKVPKLPLLLTFAAALIVLLVLYVSSHNVSVLNPAGIVASKERNLIILSTILMLVVVIPVYTMTILIAWKYRASNHRAKYTPDWDRNKLIEIAWWAIPGAIIFALSIAAWQSAHDLDPYKPLVSDKKPLVIEVVALQWRWLFIYPEQHIASVNLVEFSSDRPVRFVITSDAPMNSFWIPQLGGQIYAMPGMSTELNLMADKNDSYTGTSANISGRGFADMKFVAKSTSQTDFDRWVGTVRQSNVLLTATEYAKLAQPNNDKRVTYYSYVTSSIYSDIIMKYMMPMNQAPEDRAPTMGLMDPNNL